MNLKEAEETKPHKFKGIAENRSSDVKENNTHVCLKGLLETESGEPNYELK